MSALQEFQSAVRKHGAPATIFLIALLITSFVVFWLTPPQSWPPLSLITVTWPQECWTVVTYPVGPSNGGILGVLFGGWWLWGIGSLIERDMGTKRFVIGVLVFTILAGLCFWVGSKLTGIPNGLAGFWLILSAVTVAWGTRYPTSIANFMMVIPLQARWFAWISVLFAFFGTVPQLALFSAAPLGLVYLYAANKLPFPYSGLIAERRRESGKTRSGLPTNKEFLADVRKREQEREEKERLRKLFESSMIDNTDDDKKSK